MRFESELQVETEESYLRSAQGRQPGLGVCGAGKQVRCMRSHATSTIGMTVSVRFREDLP